MDDLSTNSERKESAASTENETRTFSHISGISQPNSRYRNVYYRSEDVQFAATPFAPHCSEHEGFNLGAVLRKRGFVLSENAFLGKGRFGKVYKALHIESDKEMAIKIIDKQKLSFTTRFKFLPREIRGWQKLHHRHIVELFHYFEEDQKVFFATQLAEKGDLLSYIQKNGPQTEHLAQSWMWQLVSAVQYMHLQWIAHRDLKLDNILLFSDNNVKISDFGLCRDEIKSEHELSMTYCGSKAFMAPEVLLALPHPPFKADVWSLGIIAFALLTNRYPFDHRATIIRMIKAQRSRAYRFPERIKISAACRYTIDALLTYDFAMRPTIHQASVLPWLFGGPDNIRDYSRRQNRNA
ncbi:Testis-specific serine/threonine-protein kinase 4 [Toxocara canis]|uniref:Testis-specific serine/threonine-protein kinase 4 n=1 Tax=Toxocara canis TaxID=6265 RepID=A0A0B2W685_TOXCA|nr:Testis-specific serine/threonine-protein kinase 4 [Toxocara canis]